VRPSGCTVHPRARGEHAPSARRAACAARSIPAHAGNTTPRFTRVTNMPVHPRARGEHLVLVLVLAGVVRSIPAHAGNTGSVLSGMMGRIGPSPRTRGTRSRGRAWLVARTVHPRARGEHEVQRGELLPENRSIPAHAGNTLCKINDLHPISGPKPAVTYGWRTGASLTGSLKRSTACLQAASCTATSVSPSVSTRVR
jgi:hypothetical protein